MRQFNGFYSGRNFESYCKRLGLENFDNYTKILDVGSGFSTCVSALLNQGKESVALDLGYEDTDKMIQAYFSQPIPKLIVDKYPNAQVAKKEIMKIRQKHIIDFLKTKKNNYGRYIAGDCFNLPFKDNFFDLAINIESLGNEHYFSYEPFLQGIQEMARVAREIRVHSKYLHKFDSKLKEALQLEGLSWKKENNLLVLNH